MIISSYVSLISVDHCILGLVVSDSCFPLLPKSMGSPLASGKYWGQGPLAPVRDGQPRNHLAGFWRVSFNHRLSCFYPMLSGWVVKEPENYVCHQGNYLDWHRWQLVHEPGPSYPSACLWLLRDSQTLPSILQGWECEEILPLQV